MRKEIPVPFLSSYILSVLIKGDRGMKKTVIAFLLLCIFISGCSNKPQNSSKNSSDSSLADTSTKTTSESSSKDLPEESGNASEQDPTKAPSGEQSTTSTPPPQSEQTSTEEEREYLKLNAFEKAAQQQLDQMLKSNLTVTANTDKAHIPNGAEASIKMEYKKQEGWAQFLDMAEGGNGGIKVLDPFPMALSEYEGIRMWMEILPADHNGFETLTIMVGDWSYGYRSIFQKEVSIPPEGFKGYIDVGFDELVDFYGTPSPVDPNNLDYIGFKLAKPNGCYTDTAIYISDIQAYRSK